MTATGAAWETESQALWGAIDKYDPAKFRELIDAHAAKLPAGSAVADFERACSFDSTGHPDKAVPLYRRALETGLTGERRRRVIIQLSSSLRNLGNQDEAIALLTAEQDRTSDSLDDAVRATLALALTDVGREREAVSLAVGALAKHLPRYQRSMANYARLLLHPGHE
ncbi:MAG: tetratricopeptide repeat protein [Stackebrandtia sp.]